MISGNFLIGEGLSSEGFNLYVEPFFEERGYHINNKLDVEYQDRNSQKKSILISIVGDGDLEKKINDILVELGEIIEKEYSEQIKQEKTPQQTINQFQIMKLDHLLPNEDSDQYSTRVYTGLIKTIGIYQTEDTASELFPMIAQNYLLDSVTIKHKKVAQEIKDFFRKKICDL